MAKPKLKNRLKRGAKKTLYSMGLNSDQAKVFAQSIKRLMIVIIVAFFYWFGATWMLLDFLPANFKWYNNIVRLQGTTNFDVWLFWAWVPTLLWFFIGMLWAGGILGWLWDAITD